MTTTSNTWTPPSAALASILEALPRDGAIFAGRVGAVPLPAGRALLVHLDGSEIVDQAVEPRDNQIAAPDASIPTRRPGYLDEVPLFTNIDGSKDVGYAADVFRRLWPRRDERDEYVHLDPYTGGMIRIAQALRANPRALALSYRLRFGAWNDPEVAYQLTRAVQGMADAGSMLGVPLVAGELACEPGLGLHPEVEILGHPPTSHERIQEGDTIALLGRTAEDLSGSLYIGEKPSLPPPIDLVIEGRLIELLRDVPAAAPLGRGGLLITLARCCATAGIGARVTLPKAWSGLSEAAMLFSEAQSRSLVFQSSEHLADLRKQADLLGLPLAELGRAGGQRVTVEEIIDLDLKELN